MSGYRNRAPTVWTEKQDELLRKYHSAGLSFSDIAIKLNEETGSKFSRNSTIGRAHRIGGFPTRVRTPDGTKPRRRRGGRVRYEAKDWYAEFKKRQTPVPKEFLGIGFFDLQPNHCRFPQGDGLAATYCGQPVIEGSSYCAYCHSICYGEDPPPAKIEEPEKLAA